MEKYFFSIPIYRLTHDDFYKKSQARREKSPKLANSEWTLFDKYYSYQWAMNEIVGWLRLYFYYSALQVDLVLYEHKRKYWHIGIRKKKYQSLDRLTEIFLETDQDPQSLTAKTIESITASQINDSRLREFIIDFDEFRQVGNALDWRKIKLSSNPTHVYRQLKSK